MAECLSRMHQDLSSVTVTAGATTINTSKFSMEPCALIPGQEDTDRWKTEGHWPASPTALVRSEGHGQPVQLHWQGPDSVRMLSQKIRWRDD